VRLQIFLIVVCLCVLASIPPSFLVLAEDAVAYSSVADVRVGVLGLFHPVQLTVSAPEGSALSVHAGEEVIILEKSSGVDSVTIRISGSEVVLAAGTRVITGSQLSVTGRNSQSVDFLLTVPEKIVRRYHGTLEIKPNRGMLSSVVTMDRETAVASVVAAENTPDTPFEALKAQAVAARSYFAAGRGRHRDFDFCDTTHCQFLREPPAPESAAAKAAAATRNLVLAYEAHPIAAMYTRSCGGRTRTPAELGISPAAYPYYSVECKHCRAHPVQWSSRVPAQEAATLHSFNESARLAVDRQLGWAAAPSNDFVAKIEPDQTTLEGTGEGHGIGLCQSGAKAMAEEGADFREILSHYYPNTAIVAWPRQGDGRQVARLP